MYRVLTPNTIVVKVQLEFLIHFLLDRGLGVPASATIRRWVISQIKNTG
jgi:hypothetical protein